MIAPKLLIPAVGLTGAVTATTLIAIKGVDAWGGESSPTFHNSTYSVVTIELPSEENAEKEPIDKNHVNNFVCSFENKSGKTEIDDTCDLFELNMSKSQETIDWYNLRNNPNKMTVSSALTTNKKYILRLSESYHNNKKEGVKVLLTSKSNKEKNYGSASEVFLLDRSENEIQPTFALVKLTGTPGTASTKNSYKCQINKTKNPNKEYSDCKIYSFRESLTTTNAEVSFNKSQFEPLTTSSTNKSSGSYVLIEFSDPKDLISYPSRLSEVSTPIIFVEGENGEKTKFSDSEYVSSYIGKINDPLNASELLKVEQKAIEFLVVATAESANIPQEEMAIENEDKTITKNYKCQLTISSQTATDEKCSLIRIAERKNSIEGHLFRQSQEGLKLKKEFKTNTYFKLVVNSTPMITHNYGDNDSIKIAGIGSSNINKQYGTVKVIGKYIPAQETLSPFGKTKLIFVKRQSYPGDDVTTFENYKCKFEDPENTKSCEIYKLEQKVDDKPNLKLVDLSNANKKITSIQDIKGNDAFVIKLTATNESINTESIKYKNIFLQDSSGNDIVVFQALSSVYSTSDTLSKDSSVFLDFSDYGENHMDKPFGDY